MTAVRRVAHRRGRRRRHRRRHPARREAASASTSSRPSPTSGALGSGITLQGNACASSTSSACGTQVQQQSATRSTCSASARPDPDATVIAEIPDARPAAPTSRRRSACTGPTSPASSSSGPSRSARGPLRARRSRTSTQGDDDVELVWHDADGLHRQRYDLVIGADGLHSTVRALLGIDVQPRAHRHGHLARLRAAARRRSPAPTSTTAAPATSPGTARPARTRIYAYLVEDAQDRIGPLPRGAGGRRSCARLVAGLPRPVGRHPRRSSRRRRGSTTRGSPST